MPTPEARRHRVAVIGMGAMGARHARVLAELPARFELVGGFDVRPGVAPSGVRALASEDEALELAHAIVIATPIETHAAIAHRALTRGLAVLVEKPLAMTAADARALASGGVGSEGMPRRRARLFVGHSERFNPVVRALSRLLAAEEVLAIDTRRVGPGRPGSHGVLLNLAVHDFDLAAYLGGGAAAVRDAALVVGSTGVEDAARIRLTTRSRAAAQVYVDRTIEKRDRRITVITSRWRYEGDLVRHTLARTDHAGRTRTELPVPYEEPLAAQAHSLADALDGGEARELATGAEGAAAVILAEQAAARAAPGESCGKVVALDAGW